MNKVYLKEAYLELESELEKARRERYSLAIASLPGMGVSFMLKAYSNKHKGVKYINVGGEELLSFNIIDLDLWLRPEMIDGVEAYFKKARVDQKLVVVINSPGLLEQKNQSKYAFWGHIYKTYYLRAHSRKDCDLIIEDLGIKMADKDKQEIFEKSQGIAKLVKFLAVNRQRYKEEDKEPVLAPIEEAARGCPNDLLIRFGLNREGVLSGTDSGLGISINFDLSFEEEGVKSDEKLSRIERDILIFMTANGGEIAREKVADFKWGEGKYDEFSDQAINKTMRRLSGKLSLHQIETIPKVGYKLRKKDGS